jgi:hypothetical protein
MENCKNCGAEVQGAYCSHCGEKAKVERITFLYIWNETAYFFTHLKKGFLFTSWSMLIRPGSTVKNFIEGKRKPYQPPVSYGLIWIAIFILFLYWIQKVFGENVVIDYKEYFGPAATTQFAISHLGMVLLILIPFQTLYLWLLVTKKWHYYFETMIAVLYALGTIIQLQFLFAVVVLIMHLLTGTSVALQASDPQKILYLLWVIISMIKLYPVKQKFLRVAGFVLLAFGTFTLWRLYGFPNVAKWFF